MQPNSKTQRDFDWQAPMMLYVKHACAPYLIRESSPEEDRKRNTDLTVDTARVSVRIRRYNDLFNGNYANEFTIRTERPSGAETELSKIIAGWGTYTFYGFANQDCTGLAAWVLGDLNVFRRWFSYEVVKNGGKIPGVEQPNPDGSSKFRVFTIDELPPEFVIARLTADMGAIAQQAIDMSTAGQTAIDGWTPEEREMWGL